SSTPRLPRSTLFPYTTLFRSRNSILVRSNLKIYMKRKSITKAIAFSILAFGLWSCEQDFTEMGSEIIDNDQFGFDKYVVEHVSAVNHESGIANTRNLPTNSLGV